jgi:hypothetical protein
MYERSNDSIADSVTIMRIKNTSCIICGSTFMIKRAGKLYCSSRCRQAGYYHKDKIFALRKSQYPGNSNGIFSFRLKEYQLYCQYQERIRSYRRLERQFENLQPGTDEWNKWYKNPNCALSWERKKIPAKIINLAPISLSIEQWSFLKSLYPGLNLVSFIEFVAYLSHDFFNELTTEEGSNFKHQLKISPIKIKYRHHLNKIVSGEIRFI